MNSNLSSMTIRRFAVSMRVSPLQRPDHPRLELWKCASTRCFRSMRSSSPRWTWCWILAMIGDMIIIKNQPLNLSWFGKRSTWLRSSSMRVLPILLKIKRTTITNNISMIINIIKITITTIIIIVRLRRSSNPWQIHLPITETNSKTLQNSKITIKVAILIKVAKLTCSTNNSNLDMQRRTTTIVSRHTPVTPPFLNMKGTISTSITITRTIRTIIWGACSRILVRTMASSLRRRKHRNSRFRSRASYLSWSFTMLSCQGCVQIKTSRYTPKC